MWKYGMAFSSLRNVRKSSHFWVLLLFSLVSFRDHSAFVFSSNALCMCGFVLKPYTHYCTSCSILERSQITKLLSYKYYEKSFHHSLCTLLLVSKDQKCLSWSYYLTVLKMKLYQNVAWKWKVKVKSLSRVWLLATQRSLPCSSVHGIFQALTGKFLTTEPPGKSSRCIFSVSVAWG